MNQSSQSLIQQFKALADPVRLRIVALCSHGECSVSEFAAVLAQSQPRVSQHLKQLCDCGLLIRFRDGHFVYYRIAGSGADAAFRRRLLALIPEDEPQFDRDLKRLRERRGDADVVPLAGRSDDRALHRALVALTVTDPLGDLLDVGSGQGRILKLLASRSKRAVGVDIDSDARRFARSELLLAGLPNCTLRQGDMYELPFDDREFDTVILDDVLDGTDEPVAALVEASRLLGNDGRLILLMSIEPAAATATGQSLMDWCKAAQLRLGSPTQIPSQSPRWLLAVATRPSATSAVA